MDETERRRQQRRQILANGGDPFKETVSQDFLNPKHLKKAFPGRSNVNTYISQLQLC
jgi:hypothetical protein